VQKLLQTAEEGDPPRVSCAASRAKEPIRTACKSLPGLAPNDPIYEICV
jgi:hypothetical protein